MGNIKRILHQQVVEHPPLNERFIVELAENVHVHLRNIRLEFSAAEFLLILRALKGISEEMVQDFDYRHGNYLVIAKASLPPTTEFDDRLQIEEQRDGSCHVHYRNLRLEDKTPKVIAWGRNLKT